MVDPSNRTKRGADGGGGGGAGIASRYLAAIGASSSFASQRSATSPSPQPPSSDRRRRHHRQAFGSSSPSCAEDPAPKQPHPQQHLPAALLLGRRSAQASSFTSFSNAVSPKSTRTERTYPLDQSAGTDEGSSSWDEDPFSPSNDSGCALIEVVHEEQGDDEGERPSLTAAAVEAAEAAEAHAESPRDATDQPSPLSASPLSHPSDEPFRCELPDASTGERRTPGDLRFEPQQQLQARHKDVARQRPGLTKGEKDPPTWGSGAGSFRIFLEARQLFAGCEGDRATDSLADGDEDGGGAGGAGGKGALASLPPSSAGLRRAPSDVKSDVTNASTQIATNRAVDVAFRQRRLLAEHRKQEQELSASQHVQTLSSIHEQHVTSLPSTRFLRGPLPMRAHPPRYSFGNHTHLNPAQLEAKSVLSLSSNDESSMSRTPQKPTVDAASLSRASCDESNDGPNNRPATDRLSQHVQSTASSRRPNATPGREFSQLSVCEQSKSSSVGVEIDDKLAINSHSTKQVKASFQNKTLMNHELPNEAVEDETRSPALVRPNQGFVRMQTKRFSMGASESEPKFPTSLSKLRSSKSGSSEDKSCLSPPQIHRTTDSSSTIRQQSQPSSSISPDPIFCAQSESSPSHSAASSSLLSSSAPPPLPHHPSRGPSQLYSHVEDEEKEEKQGEDETHRNCKSKDGNGERSISQSSLIPAERPAGSTPRQRQSQSSADLRSTSFGDMKPSYPSRTASSIYWSRKTQSCTAVTVASVKAQQASVPTSLTSTPRPHVQAISEMDEQNPLLLPVLSNALSQDSAPSHPAPKPRQALHFPGGIRERIPRSAPPPDSPVEAALCSSFLEAIARFEKKPRKTTPSESTGHPILKDHAPLELRVDSTREDLEEEKTAFGKAVGSASNNRARPDSQPLLERRRRGIELVLGRNGRSTLTFDGEEESDRHDDDDTASVKSLREKFEPPSPPEECDRSVRKMRALFEKPKRQFTSRREAVKGPLKEAISKFDAGPSSKPSRTRYGKMKPTSGDSRYLYVGEELDSRSVGQSSVAERVHTASISSSKGAPQLVSIGRPALELASSSANMKDDDDLSILSKEYNNLVSSEPTIRSSKSFQEKRVNSTLRNLSHTRPKSADPASSHSRIAPILANSRATVALQRTKTKTRPEVINLVPTKRETPSPGPEGPRHANPALVHQQVTAPGTSRALQKESFDSSGPRLNELAVSSFIQKARQQTECHSIASGPLDSALARTSLTRYPSSRPQSDQLVNHTSIRPAESIARAETTSTPRSSPKRTTTPELSARKSGTSANAGVKSPGRELCTNEARSKSPALSRPQTPSVSFLDDNPNRIYTLERAHAALVKQGELNFLEDVNETARRASPDGAVSGDVEVLNVPALDEDSQSGEEGSEFSDGVTLDLSIAEVSNLTTPTALVSRAEPCDAGPGSSDQGSKSADLADAEAKRSEASSSQTSEAAAPLLARALGLYPRSDEFSANSFFAKRAIIANHWSKTSSLDMKKAGAEDEKESKDDSFGGSGGWDLSRIETCFPKTEPLRMDDSMFDFESDWKPFHANPAPIGESGDAQPSLQLFPLAADSLPGAVSGAKTPTRSNTSKISMVHLPKPVDSALRALPLNLHADQNHSEPPHSFRNSMTMAPPPAVRDSGVKAGARADTTRLPRTHQVANESSDDPSFWKRRAGVTLSTIRRRDSFHLQPPVHAIERLPVRLPPSSSSQHQASRSSGPSISQLRASTSPRTPPPSSVVSSTTSTTLTERAGNQPYRHAAVMDRLRMLKESRLRRSAGYSPHSVELPDADETDHSTQSSTQFGGSTFLASLDVD